MAIKGYPTSTGTGSTSLTGTNVDLTAGAITSHSGTIAANDSDLRTRLWSELVTRDAREKNVFEKFIGGEGSGKPIVEKTDLSAGGSDKVTFTTVAPIRGQGVQQRGSQGQEEPAQPAVLPCSSKTIRRGHQRDGGLGLPLEEERAEEEQGVGQDTHDDQA